jgi:predicted enzyme related to lactoylglutathione lyase
MQERSSSSAAVNEHGAVNFNNLHTDDVEAARAFYGAVFGWTTVDAGSPMWALPGYGDHLEELNPGLRAGMKHMGAHDGFEDVVATILPREGDPARWSVTIAVDDVDAIAARARELGGSVLAEPQNALWVRFAVLADPAGASFTASQFVAENRWCGQPEPASWVKLPSARPASTAPVMRHRGEIRSPGDCLDAHRAPPRAAVRGLAGDAMDVGVELAGAVNKVGAGHCLAMRRRHLLGA